MIVQLRLFAAAIVILALQHANCRADAHVFGDSLSETGNSYAATGGQLPPSPLYFQGRFSNDSVWVEYLAKALGEPAPLPSLLGGTNYATSGARAKGLSPYLAPDLTEQVGSYLRRSGGTADPDDIFVIWAGANDIFFGAMSGEADFIPKAITGIEWSIEALYNAGARKFVILDLPPLGQTPFFNTNPVLSPQLDAATAAFNSAIASLNRSLRTKLPQARIADVKISKLFQLITRAPRLFGLRNVRQSATIFHLVTGIGYSPTPGANPKHYLFWDSVHPTGQGHKIIAAYVLLDYKLHCMRR